jgi:DNA-binding CsgD family transcriptional regulator
MTEVELLELSGAFYDGVLSPAGWQQGLQKLATVTSSEAASVVLWNRPLDAAIVGEQVGLPEELQKEYSSHFHRLDPGREFANELLQGKWYLDERDLSPSRIQRSPFYQDFLRRYELDSSMATPILRTPAGTDGFLSLSGRPGKRDMGKLVRELDALLPHIQRAALLRVRLLDIAQQLDISRRVLDRFSFPLLAMTAERKLMMANRLGETWLHSVGNPLSLSSTASPKVGRLLRVACGMDGPAQAGWMRIANQHGGFYSLIVIPLPAEADNTWMASTPSALIWINDPAYQQPLSAEFLRHMFHLSSSEIALTRAMLCGDTLQDWAATQELSMNTVRTQLKSVFLKLGIRRQSELQRVLGLNTVISTNA